MGVTTKTEFHPSDPAVRAIIVDGKNLATSADRQDDADYLAQTNFELVQEGIATGTTQTFEVFGVIKKTYIVREEPNQAFVDKLVIDVPAKFFIEAKLNYQAWVDKALPKNEKARLSGLLVDFLAGPMAEPDKFAADNNVDFSSFAAEPYFIFSPSPLAPEVRDDFEQDVVADMQQSERFRLEFKDEQIELGDINIEHDGIDADDLNALQDLLEQEYEDAGCDHFMEVTEHKVKDIIRYSEFKTVIAWKWITIGCCKTKLYYPKVLTQTAQKSVFVEVISPDDIAPALKTILKQCGEKAAKTSLAVAFVAWVTDDSLEKALIAFKSVFTECVEERFGELVNCIVPVIVVKKRIIADWRPAF